MLGTLAIVLFGKSVVAWDLVRLLGHSHRIAVTIAVSLAQIGEFAFILAGLGISLNLISEETRHLVLAAAILSVMINPVLFSLTERLLNRELPASAQSYPAENKEDQEQQIPLDICQHAVVVGYGRVGSLVCQNLLAANIPVVVVENNRARIEILREQGISAVYGNATHPEVMKIMRLDCASWLLLTIPNGYESGEIAASARESRQDIFIFARAHYDDEVNYLLDRGCDRVIMGEREIAESMSQGVGISLNPTG